MIDISIIKLLIYIVPFFRFIAFLISCPILGANYIPIKIKIVLALILNIIIIPNVIDNYYINNYIELILMVVQEIFIGLILGFTMQMFMVIFNIAGQIVATQMGLGFVANIDPNNGVSSVIIAQLFLIIATLLFLSLNLHLLLIEILINSFIVIPNIKTILWNIINKFSWILASGLLLSLPIITILIMLNLLFGIISKTASSLNIFALGFSVTLIVGLLLIYLFIKNFIAQYYTLAHNFLLWINDLNIN